MPTYLLGIDAGTSVIKAAVFDPTGEELSRGAASVPITNPAPHMAEEDMETVWQAAITAIRDAVSAAGVPAEEIVAVSATGQGDGNWLINANGTPAGPAVLWTDGRAGSTIDRWYEDGTVSAQFDISGTGPYAGTSSAILRWRKDHEPESLSGVTNLWCKDWIEYRLTGDISTDASDASLSGIDARTRQWSQEVLRTWGIDDVREVLPPIKSATDLAGHVTQAASEATGLPEGTPVYKGQMDITASSLGVGVARPGDCMAVIGTAGIVTVATDTLENGFAPADSGWVIPHSPSTWIRAMGMNFCTPNLDWFLEQLGAGYRAQAAETGEDIFALLDRVVTQTPVGSRGVLFHGYLAPGGERAPFVKPSARGSFTGITGSHTTDDMLRAVYEGVAYGIRDCLDSIPTEVRVVRMAGGGANSTVWCQIFADVLGRTIEVPAGTEFGAKGAAIVAGVGAGVFESYEKGADATVRVRRTYEPDPDRAATYNRFFPIYRRTRQALMPLWDELQAAVRETSA